MKRVVTMFGWLLVHEGRELVAYAPTIDFALLLFSREIGIRALDLSHRVQFLGVDNLLNARPPQRRAKRGASSRSRSRSK